jgi:hypothetical protein
MHTGSFALLVIPSCASLGLMLLVVPKPHSMLLQHRRFVISYQPHARAHTHTHTHTLSLSLSHVSHRHCLAIVGVCRWQVLCERCRGTTRKQCIGSKCCSQAVEHQCRIDTDAFAHQIRYMAQRCTGAAASFTRFAAFDLGNSHKQAATCWYEAAHYQQQQRCAIVITHSLSPQLVFVLRHAGACLLLVAIFIRLL